jgi:hypothetical protein
MRTSDSIEELHARGATGTTTRRPHSISRSVTVTPGLPSYRNNSPVEGELAEFIGWLCARHPEFTEAYKKAPDTLMEEGYTTDTAYFKTIGGDANALLGYPTTHRILVAEAVPGERCVVDRI